MDKKTLMELAQLYLEGKASEEQKRLLHEWYDQADEEEVELVFTGQPDYEENVRDRILSGLERRIGQEPQAGYGEMSLNPEQLSAGSPRRGRRIALRWLSAAAVLVVVASGAALFWRQHSAAKPLAQRTTAPPSYSSDIAPGTTKAKLVLGNGREVILSEAKNGAIGVEGGVKIDKQGDRLIYDAAGNAAGASAGTAPSRDAAAAGNLTVYNVISTPKGGQYPVVLADGTRVWLNAESSLRFPTAFAGKDRRVELVGEAYFEVAKNPAKPFKVFVASQKMLTPDQPEQAGDLQVEVLGTSFNVMSYDNERSVNTTLLEGSVRVIQGAGQTVLRPGLQARCDRRTHEIKVGEADGEEAIAWKNGFFEFKDADIASIMRQIARWYDVEIKYEGGAPERYFTGEVSRNVNVSNVLRIMELSDVHFRIEGRTIVVLP